MNATHAQPRAGSSTRTIRIFAKAAGAITIAFVAFMALVHTKQGRKLLAPIYGAKCPIGSSSPEDIEAARSGAARTMVGDKPAPARPVFGFALEKTTPAEVLAWAKAKSLACTEERESTFIKCTNVPADAVTPALDGPAISELAFVFEPKKKTLVNAAAYFNDLSPEVGAARGKATALYLKAAVGVPERELGSFDGAYLRAEVFRQAQVAYRFSDYVVTVSATQLRPGQVVVKEHYMAGVIETK